VFGCKVLRKIFGSKWNLEEKKKKHNERLYGLHSSPYGHMASCSEGGNKPSKPYQVLNPWATSKPLGFSRRTLLHGASSVR